MTDISALFDLLVAALGGAGIGVERQWSGHASGDNARFAGVRTFTLIGIVSGIAGWLARTGHPWLAVLLVAGPLALTVVAYAAASRRDIDATTEVAAFVAVAAGVLAGLGFTTLASGIIAITVLLLVEKSRLHSLVARLGDDEVRAASRFAVMAVVVLPLLPEGPFGPLGGIRPRELWMWVLFFTGLSFTGYIARRLVGPHHGYTLTGALAGLVSSTNATYTLARLSRERELPSGTLATGAVAACTVLFPRVATAVLDSRVALALLPLLAAPFVLGAGTLVLWLRRDAADAAQTPDTNPLQIWPALQMAATFQVVLFGVALIRHLFGDTGLVASGAVLGLTDVDALTISMARSARAGVSPETAAQAIAVGVIANSVMKATIAAAFGTRAFARRAGGTLVAMALVLAVALVALQ
jgi:uncharacterized membrane protein (DUF4010 family)